MATYRGSAVGPTRVRGGSDPLLRLRAQTLSRLQPKLGYTIASDHRSQPSESGLAGAATAPTRRLEATERSRAVFSGFGVIAMVLVLAVGGVLGGAQRDCKFEVCCESPSVPMELVSVTGDVPNMDLAAFRPRRGESGLLHDDADQP
jgi:hypothetical protein